MTVPENVSEDRRRQMIADAAYFRAERRGFGGRDPVADWLEAEAEIDARLRAAERRDLLERLEARLATVDEGLEKAKKRVARLKAEAREGWQRDVEKLAQLRGAFHDKLGKLRGKSVHAGERARQQAEKTWDEISEVLERLAARRKRTRSDRQ